MTTGIFGAQADKKFVTAMGLFYGAWTSIDLTVDCAMAHFLNVPPQQVLLLTAGMELGRKIRLLVGFVQRSDHKHKARIAGALNKLQSDSKRNVFAHSYMVSTGTHVIFLERRSGEYRIKKHQFTVPEFCAHVAKFMADAKELWDALEFTNDDLKKVIEAAMAESR